ncbi:VOC family protein [Nonomuraea pusilla]|uniref:VOC family protein n=1 Tax=Nonomuraea pusilla TaxID=46177 RepID=UPI00331D1055
MDLIDEIHRAVERGEPTAVVLRRRYDAPVEDVWDACTDPERVGRWLAPVSGDLRPGGTYQLQGNAGGRILVCRPPGLLKVSWVAGEAHGHSEVEVRLSAEDDGTLFELRHSMTVPPELWDGYGPGAVGVGWDLALLGLHLHLTGGPLPGPGERETWHLTPEGRDYITRSSRAWDEASRAAGTPAGQASAAARRTTSFYLGEKETTMAEKITPFLMFQNGDAEEAMTFYVSLFTDGKVLDVTRTDDGKIRHATFALAGQEIMCIDSEIQHGFTFTPSMSLYVTCADEDEIDRLYAALVEGGGALMPLGSYGFSTKFGWVNDRFGVSWQLTLP